MGLLQFLQNNFVWLSPLVVLFLIVLLRAFYALLDHRETMVELRIKEKEISMSYSIPKDVQWDEVSSPPAYDKGYQQQVME